MTPLCQHREEWVCERCLKCGKCCECSGTTLVHRNSKSAAEQYGRMLRGQTTPLGQPVGGKDGLP